MHSNVVNIREEKPKNSNVKNKSKRECRGNVEMINQIFTSVEKSEKAIKKTKRSIEETMRFLKELEEKEYYSPQRKHSSKS